MFSHVRKFVISRNKVALSIASIYIVFLKSKAKKYFVKSFIFAILNNYKNKYNLTYINENKMLSLRKLLAHFMPDKVMQRQNCIE